MRKRTLIIDSYNQQQKDKNRGVGLLCPNKSTFFFVVNNFSLNEVGTTTKRYSRFWSALRLSSLFLNHKPSYNFISKKVNTQVPLNLFFRYLFKKRERDANSFSSVIFDATIKISVTTRHM